jgi:alkylation response protein AidB-like acyl-CoA dehydrogenase
MDFDLSEEHRLIQETAYRFAVNEIAPQAKQCDRAEKYPREIVRRAAELGFVGPTIPEEYGGAGYGFFEHSLIVEQMARVDLGITQAIESAAFGSQNIVFFGTEEQKQKYLPPLAAGEMIAAGAYTEPDAGTDIAAARTKAVREGDQWVITGNKMFITNGTVCDFMAESGLPGLSATPIKGKMGLRASDTAEVAFEGVRAPATNLIGRQGQGFKQLMHFFDATRTVVASQGVGLAQGALDLAIAYAKERITFGRPLINNQAIQFTLAEMATRIEMARMATYRAAWLVDQGRPSPRLNSMAKYYAGETAVWVCDQALQLHGGYGYIDEYDIQRFYRDAKILEIYEGTKEAEKMVIAKRTI